MTAAVVSVPLGELVALIMGQAPPGSETNFDRHGTPFVKAGEFRELRPEIREWTTKPLRMARQTDVLLCVVGATCGKINLGEDCAIGRSVAAIRPDSTKLNQKYLYFFMLTLVAQLRAGSMGAAQTVISRDMITSLEIPLVPLAEQQRIVGILDEAFEGIATAKANAEQNLRNARAIFASCLNSEIANCDQEWPCEPIGSVCETGAGGTPLKSRNEYYDGGTIPWLLSGEVAQGEVRHAEHFITDAGLKNSSAKVFPLDTVLVAMYGATAGQVGLLKMEAATNQAVCGIFPSRPFVPEFMFFVLRSRKAALVAQAIGNAQPNISQAKIRSTLVPMVPRALQAKIVSKLSSLSGNVGVLESIYERKLHALDAVKKSLLHQAFSGQL